MEWVRSIDQLGFPPQVSLAYRRCMAAERGLVVVAGQRESGLTTTMYAGLAEVLASDDAGSPRRPRKVVTIEDPIAYPLDGVTQLEVRVGFFFDDGIDVARREGGEVIMVGGLRCPSTVAKALLASRSCLVLASLYCLHPHEVAEQLVFQGASVAEVEAALLGVFVQELRVEVEHWTRADAGPGAAP